ncbi:MAG TPA: type II toxin-antitoxin system PemK/MazF family toxin [bacterium]|nr:type II toxin-antitoxin system PemK/MazF family toxin [bacterium]HPS30747.1 type II toxin-antitoxin system PemK/MazF family toxin [bacterium]
MILKKGAIVLLSLDPVKGSEIAKTRPAVVVSNDVCNEYSPVITIVPCSSKLDKVYVTEVLIKESLDKPSKACADQIRTVDKSRVVRILGEVSTTIMKQIENAIMIHLDIR